MSDDFYAEATKWNELYASQEVGRYPTEDLIRFVAEHFYDVPDRSQINLLEVGCGTGPNLWYIAREGFSATGIDISTGGLLEAQRLFEIEGLSASFDLGSATKLPYADAEFDAVIDVECFSALKLAEVRLAISEMHRVLKPGGLAYSIAYAPGTTLTGRPVKGESSAYHVSASPICLRRFGLHRLTREEEIPELYSNFKTVNYEQMMHTRLQRTATCNQWVITATKGDQ